MNISPIAVNSVTNSRNYDYTKKQNPAFNANLKIHNEVLSEFAFRTVMRGADSNAVRSQIQKIYSKAAAIVKPLNPDVDVIIGSTRRALNDFMVYTQSPIGPRGAVITKPFGSIDLDLPDKTVDKIVNATKTLLWGVRVGM